MKSIYHSFKEFTNKQCLSGSGKTNYLLNLIQKDNNIVNKIYLYANDLEEPKYQLLINKREQAGIKSLNDPAAFLSILILWMIF